MTEAVPAAIPRTVLISKWIWLVGTAISLLSAIVAAVFIPDPVLFLMVAVTVVQAAIAVPAALLLTKRKRWARIVLLVLALLSIGSLYQSIQLQAWPTLALNLVLAATLGLLQEASAREFFGLSPQPFGRRSR